jgi:hypothetical protein
MLFQPWSYQSGKKTMWAIPTLVYQPFHPSAKYTLKVRQLFTGDDGTDFSFLTDSKKRTRQSVAAPVDHYKRANPAQPYFAWLAIFKVPTTSEPRLVSALRMRYRIHGGGY